MRRPAALVGAGPGDPELLTLRAEELLGLAAIVVVDARLAGLAALFAPRSEVVAVTDGLPAVSALLAAVARAAGPLVRLYRGDPWLHPAHGGERAALEGAGVPVESVAGVAVEVAVPALAGVPVHVRHLAVACTVGPVAELPVAADPARTLVATADDPRLLASVTATENGRLPAALVPLTAPASAWRGPLASAPIQAATMVGPALLVVGAVCGALAGPASVQGAAPGQHHAPDAGCGDVHHAGTGRMVRGRAGRR